MSTLARSSKNALPQQQPKSAAKAPRPVQGALAWGVMLAIMLPPILWGVLIGRRPLWWAWLPAEGIVVLSALTLTFLWPTARALRGYLSAYLAILAGPFVILVLTQHVAYADWVKTLPVGVRMLFAPQYGPVVFRLITVLLVAVTLIGSRLNRRDLFLVPGDLSARFQPNLVLPRSPRWWLLAAVGLVLSGAALTFFMALGTRVSSTLLPQVLMNLPFILLAAAMNAFVEEFIWRSVLLARLVPVLGPAQSNWLQATFFGLSHYYGTPSGPVGVLMAGFWGWAAGKSMLDSRGFTFNYLLHFGMDAIIFAFFVMAVA